MIYTDENQNHLRKPRSLRLYEKHKITGKRHEVTSTWASKNHVAYHISIQSAGNTGNTYLKWHLLPLKKEGEKRQLCDPIHSSQVFQSLECFGKSDSKPMRGSGSLAIDWLRHMFNVRQEDWTKSSFIGQFWPKNCQLTRRHHLKYMMPQSFPGLHQIGSSFN